MTTDQVVKVEEETARKMVADQRWPMRERLVAMATVVVKSMRLPSSTSKRKMHCGSIAWLHKRDRGRPTEATIDLKRKEFGETDAAEFVPGAEVIEEEEDEDEDGEEGGDEDSDAEEEESDDEEGEEGEDENENREEKMLTLEEKKEKARAMTLSKILTDEDFKKIDAAQLKKQVTGLL